MSLQEAIVRKAVVRPRESVRPSSGLSDRFIADSGKFREWRGTPDAHLAVSKEHVAGSDGARQESELPRKSQGTHTIFAAT